MNCYYYPILLNNHALKFYSILILSADSPIFNNLIANIYFSKVHDIIRVGKNHKIVPR